MPDGTKKHTTRDEINAFHDSVIGVINKKHCFSASVIALGDFNQSPAYVKKVWKSKFDNNQKFHELSYTGSSSDIKNLQQDNRLDRYRLRMI